jgi:hypothetical protein
MTYGVNCAELWASFRPRIQARNRIARENKELVCGISSYRVFGRETEIVGSGDLRHGPFHQPLPAPDLVTALMAVLHKLSLYSDIRNHLYL